MLESAIRLPLDFKQELQQQATKHNKRNQQVIDGTPVIPQISAAILKDFEAHLQASKRILALFGAGLSAPSGISTFRSSQDVFRGYDPRMLSTLRKFEEDPILMWQYMSKRRSMSMKASPNAAHFALARLGDAKPDYLAITQNIDNLSQRAGHQPQHLQPIHGSLHNFKCSDRKCSYVDHGNNNDPLVPALAVPQGVNIADESVPVPEISINDLPSCPACHSLLRPDVCWFGEDLNQSHLARIDNFIAAGKLDLMLVVGTCAEVHPAASYVYKARQAGARVTFVDIAPWSSERAPLPEQDWYFQGDVVDVVPLLLRSVSS